MLLKTLQCPEQPHATKNYLASNVSSTDADKPSLYDTLLYSALAGIYPECADVAVSPMGLSQDDIPSPPWKFRNVGTIIGTQLV